ncbi:hypothetical protein V0288_24885 [Pannus brasiliensis CCIBt3594]|uniref:Uncharacterized protein n=1 Tax=Pannus brasiliensis CCIBt3594 TaxID=1427578 RepID=A0AAW9QRG4_9CHRO
MTAMCPLSQSPRASDAKGDREFRHSPRREDLDRAVFIDRPGPDAIGYSI